MGVEDTYIAAVAFDKWAILYNCKEMDNNKKSEVVTVLVRSTYISEVTVDAIRDALWNNVFEYPLEKLYFPKHDGCPSNM